ncbi:polypyrimidine tract-binding protein homolog 1-like isoform X3 [Lycium barbarum]|uniref:polypyrimidine tract-binding protein homolog 1-like isoform X3 n=1 Tax=Lycium barbarum TaxID=112863 RepID=UPI00293EFE8C|nr:polypyrimidine tract-binding protein homolog 1-like isoform X3 [Lycium barbarum]
MVFKVFSAFGFVHKITTFEKTVGFQALAQFTDAETATSAKDALDGRSIPRYLIPELGPGTLKITYSTHTDLSVKFQMTDDKRSKGIATAPKKHKKSSRALWKEPGPAVTRDRSPSPYPPPRGAPLPHPPHGASLPYPPRGAPLPYDSMMIGMGYTQPSPFNSVDPHVSPRQGFTEALPLTPGYDTPQGFSQLPTGSQRATSSGTPTATPSPTVSHHSSASTA